MDLEAVQDLLETIEDEWTVANTKVTSCEVVQVARWERTLLRDTAKLDILQTMDQ